MRITIIAMLGAIFLLPTIPFAQSAGLTRAQDTTELSAATDKKKKAPKKQKEKVEYMRLAAPPESKK